MIFENFHKGQGLPPHVTYKIRQNATFTPTTKYVRNRYWYPGPGPWQHPYYQFGFVWIQVGNQGNSIAIYPPNLSKLCTCLMRLQIFMKLIRDTFDVLPNPCIFNEADVCCCWRHIHIRENLVYVNCDLNCHIENVLNFRIIIWSKNHEISLLNSTINLLHV